MLCKAYQQEFTFVAFESLIKSTPRTRATFSRRCSTPVKSLSEARKFSSWISTNLDAIPEASELYRLCVPDNANKSSSIVNVPFEVSIIIFLSSV